MSTPRVINFTLITGNNMNVLAYNYDILNDNGVVISNNNRGSIQLTTDSVLSSAISTANILQIADAIKQYIVANTTI